MKTIIIIYIITIFISRYFNYLMFKSKHNLEPVPFIWFIPILNLITILIYFIISVNNICTKSNIYKSFTGKNW